MFIGVQRENWGIALARGILAIIIGIIALILPDITVTVLVMLFGVFILFDAAVSFTFAIQSRKRNAGWGLPLFKGILSALVGLLALFLPAATAAAIILIIAAWAIVTGIIEITGGIQVMRAEGGSWFLLALGILSVLFGLILGFSPRAGIVLLSALVGIFAILYGAAQLWLGWNMRK